MTDVIDRPKEVANGRFASLPDFDKAIYAYVDQDRQAAERRVKGNGECTFHYVVFGEEVPTREWNGVLRRLHWERSALHMNGDSPRLVERLQFIAGVVHAERSSIQIKVRHYPGFIGEHPAVVLEINHRN